MRLAWRSRAIADLTAIRRHIAQDRPAAAAAFVVRTVRRANLLATFPEIGPVVRPSGLRTLVVVGSPYIMVYRIVRDRVIILRVIHGYRRA